MLEPVDALGDRRPTASGPRKTRAAYGRKKRRGDLRRPALQSRGDRRARQEDPPRPGGRPAVGIVEVGVTATPSAHTPAPIIFVFGAGNSERRCATAGVAVTSGGSRGRMFLKRDT